MNSIAACAIPACAKAVFDEEPGLPQTVAECHDYIEELQETESALSSEVLYEGKQHRHWKCVADMRQEALDAAKAYIRTLEADREDDRIYAYKRARLYFESGQQDTPADDGDASLPLLSAVGDDLKTLWFPTRANALRYAQNNGFRQRPEKRRVWLDLAWRDEWSLRVPITESSL